MTRMNRALLCLLILLVGVLGCRAPNADGAPETGKTEPSAAGAVRALFVGNSYTYYHDLPGVVEGLARSSNGPALETRMSVKPGATLEEHWESGEALASIRAERWDWVVLQEQSQRPLRDPASTEKYAALFNAEVSRAGGKTLLFATWARKEAPAMQPHLTAVYGTIAGKLRISIAPVGSAWAEAMQESPGLALHDEDGSHPSALGTYLAACVFFRAIQGKSPVGLAYRVVQQSTDGVRFEPITIAAEQSALLQRVAEHTVTRASGG